MKRSANIHIVDDDTTTREALQWLLESVDLETATYENAEDFLAQCQLDTIGCLILDVRMPGITGMELLEQLFSQNTSLKTIMLTGHGDVPMAVRAMHQGAFHFMQKPVDGEQLVEKVREALIASKKEFEQLGTLKALESRYEQLTAREVEVLTLVTQGLTNKVISSRLHIVERTVEAHRKRIMEKMQAGSLVELIQLIKTLEIASGGSAS